MNLFRGELEPEPETIKKPLKMVPWSRALGIGAGRKYRQPVTFLRGTRSKQPHLEPEKKVPAPQYWFYTH